MEDFYNKHYIAVDGQGRITDGWSDGPHPERDTTDAICVNEQGRYQFRLPVMEDLTTPGVALGQMTEENPPLDTTDSIPLYKWDGEKVVRRTEGEIAADRAAFPEPPPSPQERLRADVDFLAALQGVSL